MILENCGCIPSITSDIQQLSIFIWYHSMIIKLLNHLIKHLLLISIWGINWLHFVCHFKNLYVLFGVWCMEQSILHEYDPTKTNVRCTVYSLCEMYSYTHIHMWCMQKKIQLLDEIEKALSGKKFTFAIHVMDLLLYPHHCSYTI